MKKILSVLLVLTILLNVFGVYFIVKSEAVAETAIAFGGRVLVGIAIGTIVQQCRTLLKQWSDAPGYLQDINDHAFSSGDFIQMVETGDGKYRFESIVPMDASSDVCEFSAFLADYLNEHMTDTLPAAFAQANSDGNVEVGAGVYRKIKSEAINAFQNYLYAKAKLDEDLENNGVLTEVDGLAHYDFDFVGPIQGFTLPTKTGLVQASIDGFKLSTPRKCPSDDQYFSSEAQAEEYGATQTSKSSDTKWRGFLRTNVFSVGYYVIYNNELYFACYSKSGKLRDYTFNLLPPISYLNKFNTYNGKNLKDAGCTSFTGLYYGIYYGTSEAAGDVPAADVDDFIDTVGGGTITPERTDAEDLIGQLQAIGILGDNPELGLNDEGEIVSADGVDLSTLENLLNQLLEGQIQFEDFEGYLQQITQLLGKSNVNTSSIEKIQSNILAYEAEQSKSLADLKSAIASSLEYDKSQAQSLADIQANIQSIADALTAAQEGEIDKTTDEIDSVIVDHAGLAEATAIANNLGIVKQCQALIGNVLDSGRYTTNAPNFQFYYDSNKDGEQELYTALDLSFLDTPLTNQNLVDKSRFQKSMTVREFIQLLIIFMCYFGFFIKMLRKLPGLVGGAESVGGSAMEMESLNRQGKL